MGKIAISYVGSPGFRSVLPIIVFFCQYYNNSWLAALERVILDETVSKVAYIGAWTGLSGSGELCIWKFQLICCNNIHIKLPSFLLDYY